MRMKGTKVILAMTVMLIGIVGTAGAPAATSDSHSARFSICSGSPRTNCVVDGDTFWFRGQKIRIADIDTPELSPPRCGAKPGLVKLQNIVCLRFSMLGRFRSRAARATKIATAESCGWCCEKDPRSATLLSRKAWPGPGRDVVAAGATNAGHTPPPSLKILSTGRRPFLRRMSIRGRGGVPHPAPVRAPLDRLTGQPQEG